jgi:hypothetical protein
VRKRPPAKPSTANPLNTWGGTVGLPSKPKKETNQISELGKKKKTSTSTVAVTIIGADIYMLKSSGSRVFVGSQTEEAVNATPNNVDTLKFPVFN